MLLIEAINVLSRDYWNIKNTVTSCCPKTNRPHLEVYVVGGISTNPYCNRDFPTTRAQILHSFNEHRGHVWQLSLWKKWLAIVISISHRHQYFPSSSSLLVVTMITYISIYQLHFDWFRIYQRRFDWFRNCKCETIFICETVDNNIETKCRTEVVALLPFRITISKLYLIILL